MSELHETFLVALIYRTHELHNYAIKVGTLDLYDVLVVTVGQYRDLAVKALQARMLAKLGRFPGLDLEDLDGDALGLDCGVRGHAQVDL